MPAELSQTMTRPVYYSDVDINGHMNNTKYADIACDAVHYERFRDVFLSEVQINYLQESFPEDEILVFCAEAADAYYVRGADAGGQSRFEARLRMR